MLLEPQFDDLVSTQLPVLGHELVQSLVVSNHLLHHRKNLLDHLQFLLSLWSFFCLLDLDCLHFFDWFALNLLHFLLNFWSFFDFLYLLDFRFG